MSPESRNSNTTKQQAGDVGASILVRLAWRAAIVTVCVVLMAVIGLVTVAHAPIHWWMPAADDGAVLNFGNRSYSPVGNVEPLLGRMDKVQPLAPAVKGTCNVLLSQHAHTYHSDGSMSPKQLLEWHRAHGYTALAVTDHNTFEGAVETVKAARAAREAGEAAPVVLSGMEWSHCRGHYNFLLPNSVAEAMAFDEADQKWYVKNASAAFLSLTSLRGRAREPSQLATDEELSIPKAKYPSDAQMRQAFDTVHALGGVVAANHLPWGAWNLERPKQPSREDLVSWQADYIEVAAENILDVKSLDFVKEHHIGAIAGPDAHFPGQNAYGWTCLTAADPRDEASILEALRRPNAVDVLFDADGSPEMLEIPEDAMASMPAIGKVFVPLAWMGGFFANFYGASRVDGYSFVDGFCGPPQTYFIRWPMAASAVAWLVGAFLAYHAVLAWWLARSGKDLRDVL